MDAHSLILVVDDQLVGRESLASLLEPEDYRVAFAASGAEALSLARALIPDLILLDVMMPEMDGYEVCQRIRADADLALVPVVMVTALDDQGSLLRGLEAGADDFITKPFSRAELRARVRTITRLNRYRTLLDEQRRALSQRNQLLWAIEQSPDGYLFLDADGRPRDGNPQGWRYLGLPGRPAADLAEPFLALAAAAYRCEPTEAWARWPDDPAATRFLVRPEGAEPPLWLRVHLLDPGPGSTASRLVRLEDVTAQIGAQRNSWAFHSFVSHKLRTPVTSLLAGTGLVLRHGQASFSPELVLIAQTAHDGARRLARLVDDIFRYLQAPLLTTHGECFPIGALGDLVGQIGVSLELAPITCTLPDQPGARLTLGTRALELVLTELLSNARKFHPLGNPTVEVAVSLGADHAVIQVVDDGLTLTPAELARLLEPYHQVDREFTGQVPGMGLGLAMVAQICWGAGGSCRVAARPGRPGLVVELELPLAAPGL